MPEYICVRCFSCDAFQSTQRAKAKKFKCKVCNAKQSYRKIYAVSDKARDVRGVVQRLNMSRAAADRAAEREALDCGSESESSEYSSEGHENQDPVDDQGAPASAAPSIWANFLPEEENKDVDPKDQDGDAQTEGYVLCIDKYGRGSRRKPKRRRAASGKGGTRWERSAMARKKRCETAVEAPRRPKTNAKALAQDSFRSGRRRVPLSTRRPKPTTPAPPRSVPPPQNLRTQNLPRQNPPMQSCEKKTTRPGPSAAQKSSGWAMFLPPQHNSDDSSGEDPSAPASTNQISFARLV